MAEVILQDATKRFGSTTAVDTWARTTVGAGDGVDVSVAGNVGVR